MELTAEIYCSIRLVSFKIHHEQPSTPLDNRLSSTSSLRIDISIAAELIDAAVFEQGPTNGAHFSPLSRPPLCYRIQNHCSKRNRDRKRDHRLRAPSGACPYALRRLVHNHDHLHKRISVALRGFCIITE